MIFIAVYEYVIIYIARLTYLLRVSDVSIGVSRERQILYQCPREDAESK